MGCVSTLLKKDKRTLLVIIDWILCVIVIFTVPPGDAYNFVLNVVCPLKHLFLLYRLLILPLQITYPLSVINAVISFGIIYLSLSDPSPDSGWSRLGVRTKLAAAFFGFANTFLFLVPLFKPPSGSEPYAALPYWTHAAGGWTVFASGFLYWLIWAKILPWKGRYELYQVKDVGGDGLMRNAFRRLPK